MADEEKFISSITLPNNEEYPIRDIDAARANHSHGNIGSGGTLGSTASYGVATDANKKIIAIDLSVSAPNASGTATTFVTSVTQSSQGKISVARSTVPTATTDVAGLVKLGATGGAAEYSHSHGNIANGGTIAVSTSSTIANGDTIVISTSANSGKLTRASIVFDGSTETQYLTKKGTWKTPPNDNTKVKQTATTTSAAYKILLSTTSSPNSGTAYEAYYSTTLTYNPNSGALVVGGTITSGGYTVLTTDSSLAWSKLTSIPTASSSTAGIVKIGAEGGAATYGHTHSTTLTATGSASITLSANTVYTLTAGGNSVAFKMPADNDTHMNVSLAGAAITHNYILMTSTTPTSTAAQHTGLGATSLWINSADKGKFELVLGNSTSTGSSGGQYGQLALYSESTAGTYLKAASGTAWKTATLPAATGMLAMIENSTAKGSDTKPIKIAATGLITECSTYAGGTAVTLNGSGKGGTTASFYAPTAAGTSGYVLKSQGSGAPEWEEEYSIEIIRMVT